jgi:hypothetical protein
LSYFIFFLSFFLFLESCPKICMYIFCIRTEYEFSNSARTTKKTTVTTTTTTHL